MVTTAPPSAPAGQPTGPGPRRGLGLPAGTVRRFTRSAATTPGRLSLAVAGLVLLTAVTGLVGVIALQDKQDNINSLIDHREPLAAAAQQVYRSLSDADATAASAFLSGGVMPEELRARYELDIAQAGAALAKASSDVGGDAEAQEQVNTLLQQLPVYTGLVETARANNRQGFPAGAAYLREASGLMRSELLPAAQELYLINFDRLADEQDDARSFPWTTVTLTVVLLAALIATQRYLTRKTNRLLNVGLLVATGAVLVGLIWGSVALLIAASGVADGQRGGSRQVEVLVQARIVTLKCRANETLTLVARGDGPEYEDEFAQLSQSISGPTSTNLLQRAKALAPGQESADRVQVAIDDADAWLAAHRRVRELDDGGQYDAAVELAIAEGPDSAASAFAALDRHLIEALYQGRVEFLEQTTGARQATTGLAPGIAVLAVVAAAGSTMGIRQRLREYR